MTEKEKIFRRQIRNYLYNMLFYNDEMVNFSDSDEEETTTAKTTLSTLTTSAASKLQSLLPQISTPRNAATN